MPKYAVFTVTVTAAAAIKQGYFVTVDGVHETTSGAIPYGVAVHDAAIGEVVALDVIGVVYAVAHAAIAKGDELGISNTGKVTQYVAGTAIARVGIALEAATANDIFKILLR